MTDRRVEVSVLDTVGLVDHTASCAGKWHRLLIGHGISLSSRCSVVYTLDREAPMSTNNEQLIRDFCEAWSRRDVDELLTFFSPDAVYHNIPMDPVNGTDAIRSVLGMFVPNSSAISFELLNIASAGDLVFTERVDHFVMGDKSLGLPVAGVFEVRDGKIAAWRDYFDLNTFTSGLM
jgi:limonene-1,2-epoxide hydrolase